MMRRFVSAAPTGDIHQALFPSTRACIPACTGKFKSTNSVQQFHCNEKNRRCGSAARQIRRRLNIKWDMTGALFLFRFHVLAPLWCVWARAKELCAFFSLFDVECGESLLDRTRHGSKASKSRRGDATRRKMGKIVRDDANVPLQKSRKILILQEFNDTKIQGKARKRYENHTPQQHPISDYVINVLLNKSFMR